MKRAGVVFLLGLGYAACAAEQTWMGGTGNWSDALWNDSALWVDGNSAVFGKVDQSSGTITLSTSNTVANLSFTTNGYRIVQGASNGSLTYNATTVSVVEGATARIDVPIYGETGFVKTGKGQLWLTATNAYRGITVVEEGTLRLWLDYGLGAQWSDAHRTVVKRGATLNMSTQVGSAYRGETLWVEGDGVDGLGAVVNNAAGAQFDNNSPGWGAVTLTGDASFGGSNRMDFAGSVAGNGYTLTKRGTFQLATSAIISNCNIVVVDGTLTVMGPNSLGTPGSFGVTFIRSNATLNAWGSQSSARRIYFETGNFQEGQEGMTFTLAGHVTVSNRLTCNAGGTKRSVNFSGRIDGPGALFVTASSPVLITGTNLLDGVLSINTACSLYLGRTNVTTATALTQSVVTNNGFLYIDNTAPFSSASFITGSGGTIHQRYTNAVTYAGTATNLGYWHLNGGTLTLTNTAKVWLNNLMNVGSRLGTIYPGNEILSPYATLNIADNAWLSIPGLNMGEGSNIVGTVIQGIVNQTGGLVELRTSSGEDTAMRIGHWPNSDCVYTLRGGILRSLRDQSVMTLATDGKGWFKQTGGQVYTTGFIVNYRGTGADYGRLTLEGGEMNIGTTNPVVAAITNGIWVDNKGPYLVELGGQGATLRAQTNMWSNLHATLFGTNEQAIHFDTQAYTLSLSGNWSGTGGFIKIGTGTLLYGGTNTATGAGYIQAGTLALQSNAVMQTTDLILSQTGTIDLGGVARTLGSVRGAGHVTNGTFSGKIIIDCPAEGPTPLLTFDSAINLAQTVFSGDFSALDTTRKYIFATCTGAIYGTLVQPQIPSGWRVCLDAATRQLYLAYPGTTLLLK